MSNTNAVVAEIISKIRAYQNDKSVVTIGIDGPTAAGKTTLADNIKDELAKEGITIWNYRLDWSLAARTKRVADLDVLKAANTSFAYEAELHMRMEIVEDFLKQVASYNQSLIESAAPFTEVIGLESLYSREHDGTLAGTDSVELKPGLVIILEGHYSLRSELDRLIDLNMVLLGDAAELLDRKVKRVQGYRKADSAIDYFWRIDAPSFINHLERFGWNADVIIDNSDYDDPKIKGTEYLAEWIDSTQKANKEKFSDPEISDLKSYFFSKSSLTPDEVQDAVVGGIDMLRDWDKKVGKFLRTSVDQIESDLQSLAQRAVRDANSCFSNRSVYFKLEHTDAFYNVYRRRMPITLAISILSDEHELLVGCLAMVTHESLTIQVNWRGGSKRIKIKRELGAIDTKGVEFVDDTPKSAIANNSQNRLVVKTPTDLTVPAFVQGLDCEMVYIGRESENIAPTEATFDLLENGGVWIQRFAFFSEIKIFKFILECNGANCVSAGNYLISSFHSSTELRDRFKPFMKAWRQPPTRADLFEVAHNQADSLIREDLQEAVQFVADHCPNFQLKDGHLFSKFIYGYEATVEQGLQELAKMLNSPVRMLRKRATQFIANYFPGMTMPVSKLWSDLPEEAAGQISLSDYNALSPTIFAEVYLWLALRGEPGAVLGANVYDIGKNHIDAKAHLLAAEEMSTPVNLQSSLNAVGQKEENWHGYLNPKDGVRDFTEACLSAARELILTGKIKRPFFSIGLDHVNVENNKPVGRAKRFLKQGLATKNITHAVLDGAAKFVADKRDRASMVKAYRQVARYAASLIYDTRSVFLTDIEVCIGELGYIGNEALIPSEEELHLFVQAFQEELLLQEKAAVLARPTLFIGNLGTTHHGRDEGEPQVELAQKWKDHLKSENFISPVLHGTTSSHRDVLRKAALGCHKINIAGDFLHTFVDNLPEQITRKLHEAGTDVKYQLAPARAEIDALTAEQIIEAQSALVKHSKEIMNVIHSPRLTDMDKSFFHYMHYYYPEAHVDVLLSEIRSRFERFSRNEKRPRSDSSMQYEFSASMIEVSVDDIRGELAKTLWREGIRYFHIDVGDGKFISREFSGYEKTQYLRKHYPEAVLHAHLMVQDPHIRVMSQKSVIEQYIEAGVNAVAIHPRAFTNQADVVPTLRQIRSLGCRPGIIIETHNTIDEIKGLIESAELDWAVVMGVPVGFGGQIFQFSCLDKIAGLAEYTKGLARDFLIEVDGGLNMENIRLCKQAGGQLFAGWSIVKSPDLDKLAENVNVVYGLIGDRQPAAGHPVKPGKTKTATASTAPLA